MSHVLRAGVADQIAYFRAYNTDGSAKTDLTSATTGLTLSVFRVGASSVSIASLSNKATDDTAHADGAIRNVGGNLYTVDIPDAATATQVPSIVVRGSYTGGVIEGLEHPIVAYDPSLAYQQQLWTATTSTVNLSGTTIKTVTDVEADTLDIQSRIPATLDGGNMRSSVQSIGANTVSAASLASDAVAEIQSGLSTLDAAGVRASIGMASADMDTQLDAILAASGGGGDTVVVAPLVQTDSQRNTPAYIECNQYDVSTLGPFRVETATGGQFNFANQSDWIIVVWDKDDNELGVVAYGDIDFSSSTGNAVMDQYSFSPAAAQVGVAGRHTFSLRRPRGTTEQAPIVGVFNVIRCPRGPA